MKKRTNWLLCLALLLTLAVPVQAEELSPSEGNPVTDHVCSFAEVVSSTDSTCTAVGTKITKCSCGETKIEEIPMKDHSFGTAVNVDASNHKKVCASCGQESVSAHSWDGGTVTTAATCVQEGVKTYTCGCGATKTESIPKAAHDWNSGDTAKHTCRSCSAMENHTLREEVIKAATCKEAGSKKKICSVCGYNETVVLTKLTTHTYDNACDGECNVCATKREVSHSFTTVWSKDYNGHWHECTKCGEKKDFAKHVAGPAATEEQEQVCTTCNYVITPKKQHVHSYGEEWSSDKVGHWHACTKCKEEKDYASHKFKDDCDAECDICGYERDNAHKYDQEGWLTSGFEHWNVCAVCGEESKHEKHVPGAEATEKEPQLCTVCGFELAPVQEHTHDFGTDYLTDEDTHWQECECGELSVPEEHSWDAGRKSKDMITYRCLGCGLEKTEEAKGSGFSWLTLILVILALVCIGGIGAIVFILKKGEFEEDEPEDTAEEEPEADEIPVIEDEEEKMIDDFFASLDSDLK